MALGTQMRRRKFIAGLGGALVWPLAVHGQQPAMPVVGYFYPTTPEQSANLTAAFQQGLSDQGFVEGRNVAIEYRFARNDISVVPELVADLVRRRVAVIAATGGERGALEAKAATTNIPIVFETGNDPVENGLVASLNRPGGNVTGISAMNLELDGKRLALLAEAAPKAVRIGWLTSDLTGPMAQAQVKYLPTAAAALGREIEIFVATNSREVDEVIASLVEKRIGALSITASPLLDSFRVQIAMGAARHAIPTIHNRRYFAEAGGLMSYGANPEENWRLVGNYVGRILKGEKPAELPVVRPTRFEFVINLQTARLLRINIPPTLLAVANTVIE